MAQSFPSVLALALVSVICLEVGCGNSSAKDESSDSAAVRQAQDSTKQNALSGKWEKLVMHPFHDPQGTVVVEMPFPSAWKITKTQKPGDPSITGPNGVKIIDFPLQFFTQQTRPLPGVEQIVQQDLAPWAAKQGLKFVRQYEIPEISKIDKWYNDQLYKVMPMQIQIQAIGTEWETAKGEPFFLLMHLNVSSSQYSMSWSYYCNGLQAEKSHFEAARKQFIFGLANARYNLKPIAAYNQREAEKAGKSWAEHNQRMARNQANFEVSQRAFVNRSTAAHDALMSGWREQNAASDKSQERFVDTIIERQKVTDASSGQQYKVESGYSHYWMNADGKYISTDKQDYDPNLDKAINNQKWQELKKTD